MNFFRHILKDRLLIFKVRGRFHPSVQIGQRQLYHSYRQMMADSRLPGFSETGFRVFSQFEEDGKLLFLFSVIGMDQPTFIEIGSDDGINSNAANLHFNFGWHGLFIDGNQRSISRGRRFYRKYPHPWNYSPRFVHSHVTRENVNQLIRDAGFGGEIGLLSIDIDGNDYWIWKAIDVIRPRVVVIETHIVFGFRNIVVPYDPDYTYPGRHSLYHGASPVAMVKLARSKGYRLVGTNQLGFNFFFVRNDLAKDEIPEVSVESQLSHPSAMEGMKKFEEIQDWEFIEG